MRGRTTLDGLVERGDYGWSVVGGAGLWFTIIYVNICKLTLFDTLYCYVYFYMNIIFCVLK